MWADVHDFVHQLFAIHQVNVVYSQNHLQFS